MSIITIQKKKTNKKIYISIFLLILLSVPPFWLYIFGSLIDLNQPALLHRITSVVWNGQFRSIIISITTLHAIRSDVIASLTNHRSNKCFNALMKKAWTTWNGNFRPLYIFYQRLVNTRSIKSVNMTPNDDFNHHACAHNNSSNPVYRPSLATSVTALLRQYQKTGMLSASLMHYKRLLMNPGTSPARTALLRHHPATE